jgi:hypothetical protein
MTKTEIRKLLCTDQVRRGNVLGLVVESTPTHVKIVWDDQGRVPTTYSKETNALDDVRIERMADRVVRDGRTTNFFTRPSVPLSKEENPDDSD